MKAHLLTPERLDRIASGISKYYANTLEFTLEENTLTIRNLSYYGSQDPELWHNLCSFFQDEYGIDTVFKVGNYPVLMPFSLGRAKTLSVAHDSFSSRPIPALFSALEVVPPDRHTIHKMIESLLKSEVKKLKETYGFRSLWLGSHYTNKLALIADGRQKTRLKNMLLKEGIPYDPLSSYERASTKLNFPNSYSGKLAFLDTRGVDTTEIKYHAKNLEYMGETL